MSLEIRNLRERRDSLYQTAKNIVAKAETEKRSLTADEHRDWEGVVGKLEEASRTLECAHGVRRVSEAIDAGNEARSNVAAAAGGGMVYVPRNTNPGEVRAYRPNEAISETRHAGPGLGAYVRGIITGKWNGAEELRALAEG